ncbi:MAG: hypothetical protein K2X87_34395 [Gemmataceae bacterium]|nr:hypothetical protein [Gemmataceae bacterium]
MTTRLLLLAGAVLVAAPPAAAADLDRPPIQYSTAPADNRVEDLVRKIKSGVITLPRDPDTGYLRGLLQELDIPPSSQVLVFSKTSLQRSRIGPKTPRAVYFNDDVAVGFCRRGDVLELAAADPNLGTVFYTLDQDPIRDAAIARQGENCLICHGGSPTQGFPGHLARSVSADRSGELVLSRGTKRVDHSTPFGDRWGGWYVTGTSGKQSHQGNRVVGGSGPAGRDGTNVTDLRPYFTAGDYPTPHSDLVALMVLEHQGEAHNRLTRANFLTRLALAEEAEMNAALDRPAGTRSESTTRRIDRACEPVVEYLLFSEEAPLTGPVAGTSGFAEEFAARGPFDGQGRSLRQFDLTARMFKYPLSYVVYSKLFDGLPAEAKEQVYRRLWEVLTGKDRSKPFAHLSDADRRDCLEILRDTKPGLPAYWKE